MPSSLIDHAENEPIFIVGAPRSGTTLMAGILGNHSKIFIPGETHFFPDIYARRQRLGEPPEQQALQNILSRLSSLYQRYNEPNDQARVDKFIDKPLLTKQYMNRCRSYKDTFSWFMELQMAQMGKSRWGNQVPKDIFHIEQILDFYPNAKIIICVRDARDFLLSYKYKWRSTSADNVDRIQSLYHPVLTSLIWKSSIKRIADIQALVLAENQLLIRYEDLVSNPEKEIKKVCALVKEGYEPAMLNVKNHNSSNTKNNNKDSTIFSTSVGRWKTDLSTSEAYVANLLCHKQLTEMGYASNYNSINFAKVAWYFITLPAGLWRALNANKQSRGPLLPYLSKRLETLLH